MNTLRCIQRVINMQENKPLTNCPECRKSLVHPDDWGDYDDACEWGCMGCVDDTHDVLFWYDHWKITCVMREVR